MNLRRQMTQPARNQHTAPKSISDRLMERCAIQENGCWHWTGCLTDTGYGQMTVNGKGKKPHRMSYEVFIGKIPYGKEIDHTCHDPKKCPDGYKCQHRRCINPEHLTIVTHAENCAKERNSGNKNGSHVLAAAIIRRARTHCRRGHEFTSENTYINKKIYGRQCIICRTEKLKALGIKRKADRAAKRLC